jgi:hypothetical protein
MPPKQKEVITFPADGSVEAALARIRASIDSKDPADNAKWLVIGYSDDTTLWLVLFFGVLSD